MPREGNIRILQQRRDTGYFVTVPKHLVEALQWGKGDRLDFLLRNSNIEVRRVENEQPNGK